MRLRMRRTRTILALLPLVGSMSLFGCARPAADPVATPTASAPPLRLVVEDPERFESAWYASLTGSAGPGSAPVQIPYLPFEAGVTMVVYGNDPAFAAKAQAMLDRIAGLGANSVGLAFPIFQQSWTASSVYADPSQTPSLANIRVFIRDAKAHHLLVLLRPLLDEASLHTGGHWRGTISPTNRAAWFNSYAGLMRQYATVAQSEAADVLDIGTELTSMQWQTGSWLNLIASLRATFSGRLTYSDNWDTAYPQFGSALDFLGVDGFYTLNAPLGASVGQLVSAWQPWLARLNGLPYEFGRPVVLTELGTTSEIGSYRVPYVWFHGTGVSLDDQRRYYQASCRAVKPVVRGIYWWAYYLDPLPAPALDPGYDPYGKTAELQIAACFH